jgi:signal transduction histidine kinase/putative methionine-R-sulfoxide reductase with GAF domain/HAMP domain-containing protein
VQPPALTVRVPEGQPPGAGSGQAAQANPAPTAAERLKRALAALARRSKGQLFRKYAALLVALVAIALIANAAIESYYSYLENRAALVAVQREKAQGSAAIIEQFVSEIEGQLGWTTHANFLAGQSGVDQRRFDFLRLLRQAPAVTEVAHVDTDGREQLKVSRLAMDVVGSGADRSAEEAFKVAKEKRRYVGPVYFRKESEPYLTLAVAGTGRRSGVTIAEVNLKFIWDVISRIRVGKAGVAYAVDDRGLLIAHSDIGLVLRKTDLSELAQVQAARAGAKGGAAGSTSAAVARDRLGRDVLSAYATVGSLGWHVFVELPQAEAFEPIYSSLQRSGLVLLGALGLAGLAGLWLAQRMVVPIQALATGVTRIGAGDLDHRIDVKTGDELERLADGFNDMGAQLKDSYAGLERKVEARTAELAETLEYQTAIGDVLGVISRSPTRLQPVLDTIVKTAARLCDAEYSFIVRAIDGKCHLVAANEMAADHVQYLFRNPVAIDRSSVTGRVALERRTVHVSDVLADPEFAHREWQAVGRQRSVLGVPLLRESDLVGAIILARTAVAAFTEKQIELVTTFADQAVIAIENARLFEEVKARTGELTEALHQQTATADVLKTISRSTFDLQTVLDALTEAAARLCGADKGLIRRRQGDRYTLASAYGFSGEFKEQLAADVVAPSRDRIVGRVALERKTVHFPDVLADAEFKRLDLIRIGNFRSAVGVPLLRDSDIIGVLVVHRTEAVPFTTKQIELLETFADQAVIAIENARLFEAEKTRTKELARSVQELEALSEVGRAVGSTLDLEKVLKTVVARARELGDADGAGIFRYRERDRTVRLWQASGLAPDLERSIRAITLAADRTMMSKAITTRSSVQLGELAEGPDNPLQQLAIKAGFRSALFIPLARADRAFGVLLLLRRTSRAFERTTLSLLETFASQSALAIQNARLFREIEEKSRELELASRHKSQFLANMSHELRTPLNAVLGYAELMVDGIYGEVPEKALGVLARVQANGRHLLGLINDVLDLSKIEAGQLSLAIVPYSWRTIVEAVVASTESLARTKGLNLTSEIAANLPDGTGDERRLTQVLLNIVGNAIKFTDKGSVVIRATADAAQFAISVSDTGPGISEADQHRIFEEFQQVDSSDTKRQGGTGLGLAISRKIVHLHGGTITVSSAVGQGSTFRVVVPVTVTEPKEAVA